MCVWVSVLTAATWKLVPLPLSGRWAAGRWGRWELETQTSKQKLTGSEWVSECARSPSPKTFTHRSSVPPASHSSPSSYHKQQPALSTPKDREDKSVRRSVCPKPPCFACGEQLKRGRKRRRTEVYPPPPVCLSGGERRAHRDWWVEAWWSLFVEILTTVVNKNLGRNFPNSDQSEFHLIHQLLTFQTFPFSLTCTSFSIYSFFWLFTLMHNYVEKWALHSTSLLRYTIM